MPNGSFMYVIGSIQTLPAFMVYWPLSGRLNGLSRILLSFLRQEFRMATAILLEVPSKPISRFVHSGTLCLQGFDMFTDAYFVFNSVIFARSEVKDLIKGLVPFYLIFLVISAVVSTGSLVMKTRVFVEQLQHRGEQLEQQVLGAENTLERKLNEHKKKLFQTSKRIRLIYIGWLVGALECLPFGVRRVHAV